ncbi:hypothetical protein KVF89_06460 [Nocardioides carbamazepini]|uniref:hypothetical protein n=1 Tax=Nocardioides carbamazepini TaxID=2854259 RepID=UPI002149ADC9|nr:hypothetical protein [Nocardioides carbamazepini]MCR1782169.1 hypothetical protein [Nocardioides carbamazepini]
MTWTAFHNRGETLRSVIATSAVRRDGILPMDVDGVSTAFRDELDLLAALTLKWHTRLSGQIERMLAHQPMDLDEAVAIAWSNTAHELPGVRMIIDHYRTHPLDDAMASAMAVACFKERHLLAVMAGRTSLGDAAAARIGAEIEERARLLHRGLPMIAPDAVYVEPEVRGSLFERLRAVVAA